MLRTVMPSPNGELTSSLMKAPIAPEGSPERSSSNGIGAPRHKRAPLKLALCKSIPDRLTPARSAPERSTLATEFRLLHSLKAAFPDLISKPWSVCAIATLPCRRSYDLSGHPGHSPSAILRQEYRRDKGPGRCNDRSQPLHSAPFHPSTPRPASPI